MKNLIVLITSIILIVHPLYTQTYFGDASDITIYSPQQFQGGSIYFGVEKINTDFLDIAIAHLQAANRFGQWNLNNGDGTFGNYNSFFNQQVTGEFRGNVFVKLHSNSSVKDLIVGRSDGLQVHFNQQGGITDVQQNISVSFGTNYGPFFEPGIFNSSDNREDILVSTGTTTLYYLINNDNGVLSNPSTVTMPYSVFSFKLRQLNEKTEGYVQEESVDRSDIAYTDADYPSSIYAYRNNNSNGFSTQLAHFQTYIYNANDLEVADLDGDGYNDIVLMGDDTNYCPDNFEIEAFRNIQGNYIYSVAFWSYVSGVEYSCGTDYKIKAADINKDGLNDLVVAWGFGNYIKVIVFINQNSTPLFTSTPQESIDIEAEGEGAVVNQIATVDIYGGQQHDGGGVALLVSYYVSLNSGSNTAVHVKVLNANIYRRQSAPPPPIVQGFLVEYDPVNHWCHPHLHLDNRGERDFDHYEIWKNKMGDPEGLHLETTTEDTGWTDLEECVDVTGEDWPGGNCYYYAKAVDNAQPQAKVSIPSHFVYFTVGCIPVCDGCSGGDNLNPEPSQNQNISKRFEFNLSNYPNPFNPLTNVIFTLPRAAKVKITVYNSIGQQILKLANGDYEEGMHIVTFDGNNLASGIYYYLMETEGFIQTRKMLLLK